MSVVPDVRPFGGIHTPNDHNFRNGEDRGSGATKSWVEGGDDSWVYAEVVVFRETVTIDEYWSGFKARGCAWWAISGSDYGAGTGGILNARCVLVDTDGLPRFMDPGALVARELGVAPQPRYELAKSLTGGWPGGDGPDPWPLYLRDLAGNRVTFVIGVPYAFCYWNSHTKPGQNYFSKQSATTREWCYPARHPDLASFPAAQKGGPGGRGRSPHCVVTTDPNAPGATHGLDPRSRVMTSTTGGRTWDGVGRTAGYYAGEPDPGEDGVRIPWYAYRKQSDSRFYFGQPWYNDTSSSSKRRVYGPVDRAVQITRVGGYWDAGGSPGTISLEQKHAASVVASKSVAISDSSGGLQEADLPGGGLTIPIGDTYEVSCSGSVPRCDDSDANTVMLGVGGDKSYLYGLPHYEFTAPPGPGGGEVPPVVVPVSGTVAQVVASFPGIKWYAPNGKDPTIYTQGPSAPTSSPSSLTPGAALLPTDATLSRVLSAAGQNYIELGDVFDFTGDVPYSLGITFKPAIVDANTRRILSKEDGNNGWMLYYSSGGGLRFSRLVAGGFETISTSVPVVGTIYRIFLRFDGDAFWLTVNGVTVGPWTGNVSMLPNTSFPLRISGKGDTTPPAASTCLDGSIQGTIICTELISDQNIADYETAALTGPVPAPPAAPAQPTAVGAVAGSVPLDMADVATATQYRWYRRLTGGSFGATPTNTTATSAWTDTITAPGTYEYAVSAANADGESAKSPVRSVTIAAPVGSPPAVLTGLHPSAAATGLAWSWNASVDPQFVTYRFYWRTIGGVFGSPNPSQSPSFLQVLQPGVSVEAYVTQVASTGLESAASGIVTGTVPAAQVPDPVPVPPSDGVSDPLDTDGDGLIGERERRHHHAMKRQRRTHA